MQNSQRANLVFLLIKKGIYLHEMYKRKKSRFELTRASDERRRQQYSWRDKASFQKQNIILWELDSNFKRLGSFKKTQHRRVNLIFDQNPWVAQKAIFRWKRAKKTYKSLYKCKNFRRVKSDWRSFEDPAPSCLVNAKRHLRILAFKKRSLQGITGRSNKKNG